MDLNRMGTGIEEDITKAGDFEKEGVVTTHEDQTKSAKHVPNIFVVGALKIATISCTDLNM